MQRFSGAIRSFAVKATPAAAAAKSHAPPKKIYGTFGRYAEATYTAASKVCAIWAWGYVFQIIHFQVISLLYISKKKHSFLFI